MHLISRRSFIIGGGLTLLSYLFFEVHSVAVKKYVIPIRNLPSAFDGFTILHLSDLHSKTFGENQKRLLDLISQFEFDMVAFTGDMDNKYGPDFKPGLELIQGLKHKPVYFVPGNHDWLTGYQFREQLLEIGVHILENKTEKLDINGEHIWILGVDDPYLGRDRLDEALSFVSDSAPKVLLAHAPNIYDLATQSGIDLILAGHTHGGQVRLPLIGAIVAPGQGFFPKYDYGLFSNGKTRMIITGGLGESVLPIRFHIMPEIVLIKLVRED